MARDKHIDQSPRFLPIDLAAQLLPGTFEHAAYHLLRGAIDLSRFDARFRNDDTGAPAYPPRMLLTVVLCAYAHGIVSSRGIERLCREHVTFIALCGDSAPHFITVLTQAFDEIPSSVTWTPAGVRFLAQQGTAQHLYALDPATGATRVVLATPAVVRSISLSHDGRAAAYVGEDAATLPEVYRVAFGDPAARPDLRSAQRLPPERLTPERLTRMTDQTAGWALGAREVVSWTSTDGARVEGVLFTPTGYDPARRYPLLVVIHGGPTGVSRPVLGGGYVYPVVQFLAKGAVVLMPNYRGSAGYGEAFRALNVRNLGVGDAWDVLSGVDALVARGVADSTRLGVMGWSQGGYISAFLATTTTRFKAISVGAGISDWMTYYVATDIHPFTRQYLGATPWADAAIYAKTSPITYVRQAHTPTLIQHGELDRRVPIANAYELFQALQDVGVPTRLVVYKGFGHGITKPREQLAATWHNWQWFAQYLWGERVALPADGALASGASADRE